MVVEASNTKIKGHSVHFELDPPDKLQQVNMKDQRLCAIYDDEPLGFEKDPTTPSIKMMTCDTLEEIDLGDMMNRRTTYISANLNPKLRIKVI